jgi:hypothetical protein
MRDCPRLRGSNALATPARDQSLFHRAFQQQTPGAEQSSIHLSKSRSHQSAAEHGAEGMARSSLYLRVILRAEFSSSGSEARPRISRRRHSSVQSGLRGASMRGLFRGAQPEKAP